MKKLVAVVLALLLASFACAEGVLSKYGIDIDALTNEELNAIVIESENALKARSEVEAETTAIPFPGVIFDKEGYILEIKDISASVFEDSLIIFMDAYVENNTHYNVEIDLGIESVDGWDTSDSVGSEGIQVAPNKKANGQMIFMLNGMGYSSVSDIESFEYEISVWDKDKSLHNLYRSEIIKAYFAE